MIPIGVSRGQLLLGALWQLSPCGSYPHSAHGGVAYRSRDPDHPLRRGKGSGAGGAVSMRSAHGGVEVP